MTDHKSYRETLGRVVREAWVKWALEQPNPKASWLTPYDDLPESDKEADRRIGEAVARFVLDRYEESRQEARKIVAEVAAEMAKEYPAFEWMKDFDE